MKNTVQSAFNTALYSIERSAKSEREMRFYLKRREFDDEIIEQAMQKLIDYGYIDDFRLAREIVRSTLQFRGLGINRAKQKLYQKGVSSEAVEQALSGVDEPDGGDGETELKNAVKWARKIDALLNDDDPRRKNKLYSRLLNKGFSGSVAVQAINAVNDEDDCDF